VGFLLEIKRLIRNQAEIAANFVIYRRTVGYDRRLVELLSCFGEGVEDSPPRLVADGRASRFRKGSFKVDPERPATRIIDRVVRVDKR
jgi:hypothetical protein